MKASIKLGIQQADALGRVERKAVNLYRKRTRVTKANASEMYDFIFGTTKSAVVETEVTSK